MAEAALFIGWGAPVRGREGKGLEIFNESVAYWGGLQQDGRIENFVEWLSGRTGGRGFRGCSPKKRAEMLCVLTASTRPVRGF
jgi:hypothetical protein